MTIDPIIFFDFVAALFVLSVALASLAISYSQIIKKVSSQKKELEELTNQIYIKESEVLKDARNTGIIIAKSVRTKKLFGVNFLLFLKK